MSLAETCDEKRRWSQYGIRSAIERKSPVVDLLFLNYTTITDNFILSYSILRLLYPMTELFRNSSRHIRRRISFWSFRCSSSLVR